MVSCCSGCRVGWSLTSSQLCRVRSQGPAGSPGPRGDIPPSLHASSCGRCWGKQLVAASTSPFWRAGGSAAVWESPKKAGMRGEKSLPEVSFLPLLLQPCRAGEGSLPRSLPKNQAGELPCFFWLMGAGAIRQRQGHAQ